MKIIAVRNGHEDVSSFETLGECYGKEMTEEQAMSEISYLTATADQFGFEGLEYEAVEA